MNTVKLTAKTQKDLLDSLLKRSPNNYTEYEEVVARIIACLLPEFYVLQLFI